MFQIEFPFIPNGSNMFVLETDYDQFATIYSCKDFPIIGKFEYTWVMARDPRPSDDLVMILCLFKSSPK